jgi:hypothetical protein
MTPPNLWRNVLIHSLVKMEILQPGLPLIVDGPPDFCDFALEHEVKMDPIAVFVRILTIGRAHVVILQADSSLLFANVDKQPVQASGKRVGGVVAVIEVENLDGMLLVLVAIHRHEDYEPKEEGRASARDSNRPVHVLDQVVEAAVCLLLMGIHLLPVVAKKLGNLLRVVQDVFHVGELLEQIARCAGLARPLGHWDFFSNL